MGILVCAFILIISRMNTPAQISDEEIISRARELGMVETGDMSLTNASNLPNVILPEDDDTPTPIFSEVEKPSTSAPDTTETETSEGDPADAPADITEPVGEEDHSGEITAEETKPDENQGDDKPAEEEKPDETEQEVTPQDGYVILTVYSGNSSDVVAQRAQSLGLVDDAAAFDAYLCSNGYANRLHVGSFSIKNGSDFATIAKAIT